MKVETEDVLKHSITNLHKRTNGRLLQPESKQRQTLFKKLIREPFFHFVVLGAIIFIIGDYLKHHHDTERYQIKIGKDEQDRLATLWEKQYGSQPTLVELKSLVDNFIKEEIYYREGIEMNLDKNDEVIRRRIAQKLEFLQQDLVIIKDPTVAELQQYYEKNKAKYTIPEKVSFSHIYFTSDKAGDEDALKRGRNVLEKIRDQGLTRSPESGDRFAYLYDYAGLTKENIIHQFGESSLSEKIFSFPEKQWSGPVQSGYGWHLVYISGKDKPSTQPLAEIEDRVKSDYLQDLRENKNEVSFDKIRNKYTIVREGI